MKELVRIKKFSFKDESYQVEVPTVGQYLEIENQKIWNSEGLWLDLIKSQTISAIRSIQIIECVSVLKALCPTLFKNMKVVSYKEIDAIDFVDLLEVYTKEIQPWYKDWFTQFNQIIVETNETIKKQEK